MSKAVGVLREYGAIPTQRLRQIIKDRLEENREKLGSETNPHKQDTIRSLIEAYETAQASLVEDKSKSWQR